VILRPFFPDYPFLVGRRDRFSFSETGTHTINFFSSRESASLDLSPSFVKVLSFRAKAGACDFSRMRFRDPTPLLLTPFFFPFFLRKEGVLLFPTIAPMGFYSYHFGKMVPAPFESSSLCQVPPPGASSLAHRAPIRHFLRLAVV